MNISVRAAVRDLRFDAVFRNKREYLSVPDVGPVIRKECFPSLEAVHQLAHARQSLQDLSLAEARLCEAVCLTGKLFLRVSAA